MDVLDHSCSKLGFGGKMCIDGTFKFDEEKEEGFIEKHSTVSISTSVIKDRHPDVKDINDSLLKKGIPCLLISLQKNRKGHVKELHEQLCSAPELNGIKMILYVEHTVDVQDLPTALWRFCNNLDPKRDHIIHKKELESSYLACIGFDGTRKTKEFDGFIRDWPNIIVADDATIEAVDAKWDSLGIGPFLSSPSLKFKSQLYGEEAVVN
jgi:4-hydroxy-3-polyprenylbenzoate decarboxylase